MTRDEVYQQFLEWRNVTNPCDKCGGAGIRTYSDTTTWRRRGFGGQMLTSDVCDVCWGSGDSERKWANLKRLSNPE